MVQWLRFHAPNTGGMGLIPGRGIKIPHAAGHSQETTKTKIKTTVRCHLQPVGIPTIKKK